EGVGLGRGPDGRAVAPDHGRQLRVERQAVDRPLVEGHTALNVPQRPPGAAMHPGYCRPTMDFELPPELAELAAEAAEVAREWSARTPFPEASWIVGHDPELAQELAARGWIGMT